jgi:putative ABC transport system permease protein
MTYTFFVRTAGAMSDAIQALRRDAEGADPASLPFGATSLEDFVAQSLFTSRIAAGLLSVLAAASILLAAIGLYGVTAYAVAQRTSEIGIRVTLGARPEQILSGVLRQGLGFAVLGLGTGWLAAMALTRLGAPKLAGVSAMDPLIYCSTAIFVVAIAISAIAIPAWRAMRLDPTVALRYE